MSEIEPPAAISGAFTYDPELGPGYYIKIRSDFLRSAAFSCAAKVLYEVLLTYAGEGATAWPGQARLAEHLGVTDRYIRNLLKNELIPTGLVTVERLGLTHTNRYHLHKLPTLPPKAPTPRAAPARRARLHLPAQEPPGPAPGSLPTAFDIQAGRAPNGKRQEGEIA